MDLIEQVFIAEWKDAYNIKIVMPEEDDIIVNEFLETVEDVTNFMLALKILIYATSMGLDDLGDYLSGIIDNIPDISKKLKEKIKLVSDNRYDKNYGIFIYEIKNNTIVRLLTTNFNKEEEDLVYEVSAKIAIYVNNNDNL